MQTGISLYPGLVSYDRPFAAIIAQAASYGISRIFTSLHIPETDTDALRRDLRALLRAANHYHLDVIADVSPASCQLLGVSQLEPTALLAAGITTARLDFGFDVAQTALWSKVMPIQLNASTLQSSYLDALRDAGADFAHIDGLHNFYPRPNTGMSEDFLAAQNTLLHSVGIRVGAFVPSQYGRRGPLYEGLPTLEAHRADTVLHSGRHLALLGVDSVFIGDAQPDTRELQDLQTLTEDRRDVVVLRIQLSDTDWRVQDLLGQTFTSRLDEARDIIRAQESRAFAKGWTIEPDAAYCRPREPGDITLDTTDFLRYQGELQIIKRPLPQEKRTNIVARIIPEDMMFLPYVTAGRKFRFELIRS